MNLIFWKKKNIDDGLETDAEKELKSLQKNLMLHRFRNVSGIAAGIVIAIAVILGIQYYLHHKVFTTHEVIRSYERTDTMTTQYTEFLSYVIKYGQDGISCVDNNNQPIWSQSYTMQHPLIDVCNKSLAIAEENGTRAMIFDESGLLGEIKTTLPIQKISVSNQGVLAVMMDDNDLIRLNLYDKTGSELVSSKFELQDAGYPLGMSLSTDATKLAVSFLQVQNGSIVSCLAFYNFDSVGENYEDHLVSAKTLPGIVLPSLNYFDNSHCAAVGTDQMLFYEGKQIPEQAELVPVDREIRSVFYSDEHVGLIMPGNEEKYLLRVYNLQGKLQFEKEFSLEYTHLKFSGKNILIYNENDFLILNLVGQIFYSGTFDESIVNMYTIHGNDRFGVMHSSRTDIICLE